MSYILDALRRAEAQRSRGAVPTLHAPALDAGPVYPVGAPSLLGGYRLGLLLIGVAVLVGLGLWAWWSRTAPVEAPRRDTVAATASTQPAATAVPTVPGATAALTAPPPSAPAAVPMTPTLTPPVEPPQSVAMVPAAPRPPATRPLTPAREATPPPIARPAESPILQRRELPADLQRELPALSVSGTVYSSDRAQRILMVNGELLHEGDHIGPELVLEEIRRKDAVLRYKGQRFSVSP